MPRKPLIVLKFGGSVLVNPDRLRLAVHEIYRWRRKGFGVIVATGELEVLADVAGIIHQTELAKDSRVKICQFKVKECLGQTKSRGIASS